ncbi:hypothetical protein H8959_019804 [Pygathrix nigripes]
MRGGGAGGGAAAGPVSSTGGSCSALGRQGRGKRDFFASRTEKIRPSGRTGWGGLRRTKPGHSSSEAEAGRTTSRANSIGAAEKGQAFPNWHPLRAHGEGGKESRVEAAGIPWAGVYPVFGGPPNPAERHVCSERILHTNRDFIRSLTRVRTGSAGNKENARTWRRSEGGLAGPPLAKAPRSHSPPGCSPHGQSLPPRRRTPPSQLTGSSRSRRPGSPFRELRPSSTARARVLFPARGSQRWVLARARPSGFEFPRSQVPGRDVETDAEPSGKTRRRRPPSGQEPRGGRGAGQRRRAEERAGSQRPAATALRGAQPHPRGTVPPPPPRPAREGAGATPRTSNSRPRARNAAPLPLGRAPRLPSARLPLDPRSRPTRPPTPPNHRRPRPLPLSEPSAQANEIARRRGRLGQWVAQGAWLAGGAAGGRDLCAETGDCGARGCSPDAQLQPAGSRRRVVGFRPSLRCREKRPSREGSGRR